MTNTRSIAALAAKKRNRAQSTLENLDKSPEAKPLYRPNNNNHERHFSDKSDNSNRDAYLTPSRLDKHNRTFVPDHPYTSLSKQLSEDSLSTVTKHTAISDHSLPPLRRVGDIATERNRNMRQWVPVDPAGKRKKKEGTGYTHQVGCELIYRADQLLSD